jgi:hypothetical protein
MTEGPTHQELQDTLPAAALEILESGELQVVLAHAAECAQCAQSLEEYREVIAALAGLLPRPSLEDASLSRIRARLLGRARQELAGPANDAVAAPLPSRRGLSAVLGYRWTGWMAAAGMAGVLLVHHAIHRPLAYGWLAAGILTLGSIVLGVVALAQGRRASALRRRLVALDLATHRPESEPPPVPATESPERPEG